MGENNSNYNHWHHTDEVKKQLSNIKKEHFNGLEGEVNRKRQSDNQKIVAERMRREGFKRILSLSVVLTVTRKVREVI